MHSCWVCAYMYILYLACAFCIQYNYTKVQEFPPPFWNDYSLNYGQPTVRCKENVYYKFISNQHCLQIHVWSMSTGIIMEFQPRHFVCWKHKVPFESVMISATHMHVYTWHGFNTYTIHLYTHITYKSAVHLVIRYSTYCNLEKNSFWNICSYKQFSSRKFSDTPYLQYYTLIHSKHF